MPVRLFINVEGQCYSDKGYDNLAALTLLLQLRIVNVSSEPIILQSIPSDFVPRVLVSHSRESALNGHHEIEFETHGLGHPPLPMPLDIRQAPVTVLPPGESYILKGVVSVPVTLDERKPEEGFVSPGEHVLQVEFATWRADTELAAKRYRAKWRKHGFLMSGVLTSEPTPLKVVREPQLRDCASLISERATSPGKK